MNIEIRKLTPELLEDYLYFFDTTPHSTNKLEHRCYCVCWCNDDYTKKDFSTAEKRRDIAIDYINGNNIQGYLAYLGNKVIGWCNTNTKSDCYKCCSWQMFMGEIRKDNSKVKSVFCFTIAPEFRGQGIASLLLERVCKDAREEGFDFVEAYPNIEFINTEDDFMGPIKLYEKCGFTSYYEANNRVIMRKKLE
ncbi:MAG: GCN5-related N-acetyltransferase [Haloplasmataceae bacterium]|jgi:ribosomal protein S18 acetylase RimI-like enzyme|nr:GCN5-related N-acetyltransferase [Haloplasmataceae bacterium]